MVGHLLLVLQGEERLNGKLAMREIEKTCPACGAKLVEIDFNTQWYMHLCLNDKCRINRQPQGGREKIDVGQYLRRV